MSTATDELSPEDALATVRELGEMDEAIERSMFGITWVLWGLVLAGMLLSYSVWEAAPQDLPSNVRTLLVFLFVPWVLLGVAATRVLWRSAGLGVPSVDQQIGRSIGWALAAAVLVGVILALSTSELRGAGIMVVEMTGLLLAIGVATVVLGVSGFGTQHARERRALWIGGLAVVLLTLATTALAGTNHQTVRSTFWIAGPAIPLAVYTLGGLYLARRG